MIAKQYTINLPADYDMAIIRRRVADNGHRFDDWPGLALKAFLISERATGATANRYAPFYLWNDTDGLNEFLYGPGFAGLSGSFGRPQIEHWIALDTTTGPAEHVRWATREDHVIHDADLGAFREAEQAWLQESRDDERGLHAAVVAVDPYRWHAVRLALWSGVPGPDDPHQTTYEVLHLSQPAPA
jgi:hypothetical protein